MLAATPFFAYRNLLSQILKVVLKFIIFKTMLSSLSAKNDQNHRVSGYASHFQVAIALFVRVIIKKPFMH